MAGNEQTKDDKISDTKLDRVEDDDEPDDWYFYALIAKNS